MKRNVICASLVLTMILTAASCSSTGETQGSSPSGETQGSGLSGETQGNCGDGVCDQAEQANPSLCPQDCVQQPPSGETGSEPQGGSAWSARVVWDCDADYGNGQIDRWSVEINYDFDVGADGTITGSGQGKQTRAECARPDCSCSLAIDDFAVDVSGLQQEEYFSIQMTPRYSMQQCVEGANCPGCFPIRQLEGCGCVGGPLDVTIEAQDGAIRSFECNPDLFPGAIAHGNTVLTSE
jgi:hypothetical protein